jgi:hypothetical protein
MIGMRLLEKVSTVMENRGIKFPVNHALLKQSESGLTWLLVIFDFARIDNLSAISDGSLIRHLNYELSPYRLILAENKTELVYAILLDELPAVPEKIELSFREDDVFQIGRDILGHEVAVKWSDLGHVIVAGMTGSGKSVFMRSITNQAIQDGFQLALIDLEDMTFGELAQCKNLVTPIGGVDTAERVLDVVLGMIEERKTLFSTVPGVKDIYDWNQGGSEKLPLVLLAIDEFNATIQTFGGIKSDFASKATQVAWRGRKYGIIMVIAGQTFEKVIVGPVRDQMITKICFQVTNASTSRIILGEAGAEDLSIPGRAITNRWGLIQTYHVDSFDVHEFEFSPFNFGLDEMDINILDAALVNDGKLTYELLTEFGFTRTEANKFRERMRRAGIAEVDKSQNNSLVVKKTAEILQILQSQQS